jgi:hypothetical protein
MKKFLIIIAIVLVLVIAAGVILVSNLDRIVAGRKDALLAQAQERIGRELSVGEITVAVWPGIGVSLKDVTVADDPGFSNDPFARVGELRVNVKLMPLLRKQVEVKRLVLRDATITLIADENGVRNIDSMIPSSDAPQEESTQSAAAIPLVLAFADVKNGTVRYVNRATGLDHTVSDLDFTARDVSLDSEVSFELSAAVVSPETDVRVGGKAGPVGDFAAAEDLAQVPVDLELKLGPMEADAVRAVLPPGPAADKLGALDAGRVDVSLNVRGTLGDLSVEGLVAQAAVMGAERPNLSLKLDASGLGPVGGFDPGTVSVAGTIEAEALSVDAVRAALPPGPAADRLGALDASSVDVSFNVRGTLGDLSVEDLVAQAAVMGAERPNLSLKLDASGLDPVGGLDPGTVSVTGTIEAEALPLTAVRDAAGTAGAARPDLVLGGTMTARATFAGTAAGCDIDGVLDLTNGAIALGESFRKPAGVTTRASLKGRYSKPALHIEKAVLEVDDMNVTGDGTVAPENVDMRLRTDDVDVSVLTEWLPALATWSPTGRFSVAAKVAGSTASGARPNIESNITLKDVGATLEQLPKPVRNVNGSVVLTGSAARIENASLMVGRSAIDVSASATRLEPLELNYRISSDRLWRGDFQPRSETANPRPEILENVVATGRVWRNPQAPPDAPVNHEGTVTSARGVLANLDYTDLQAKTRSDGPDIVIDSFSAKSLDGTVTGNGRVELAEPLRFDVHTEVKQINLAKYFKHKFPGMARVIEGRIDLNVNLTGSGNTWEEISSTLEGGGGAIIVRGSLLSVNLANELVAGIMSLPLVPSGFQERLRAKHPRLFKGNKTAFENLDGEFEIDGGKIKTDDLFLKAADFYVEGDGWFSFDRSLNLEAKLYFSPALSRDIVKELPMASYLQNSDGRVVLPVFLSGDVLKPTIEPDSDVVSDALEGALVDEGKSLLKDEVKDKFGDELKSLLGTKKKKKRKRKKP